MKTALTAAALTAGLSLAAGAIGACIPAQAASAATQAASNTLAVNSHKTVQSSNPPASAPVKMHLTDAQWHTLIDNAFVRTPQKDAVAQALQARIERELGVDVVVAKTPFNDLYEVHDTRDNQTFYTNANYDFVLSGYLFSTQLQNLTGRATRNFYRFDPSRLPLTLAIKHVNGNGARKVYTLEDANCGYCRREDRILYNLPNATIYTFPVAILTDTSAALARDIWCAPNPDKAWFDWMLHYQKPPAAPSTCQFPQEALSYLARKVGLHGTPLNLFEDGTRVEGLISSEADFERIFKSTGQ